MRVLVCGGRDFHDYRFFAFRMNELEAEYGRFDVLIHGGAKGADHCSYLWANSPWANRSVLPFAADWKAHGKSAGPKRNQKMLDEGKPDLVIAFPGGRGTSDMVRRAKKAGIEVIEVAKP
jgi:hypothetical protein